MYVPRTVKAIAQSLGARVVARTQLTDLTPGSVLERILWTFAEELALVEQRLASIRDSFNPLNPAITLQDLDERLGEFPPDGVARSASSYATGDVLSVTRTSAVGIQTMPANSVFQRVDTGVKYKTIADVVFPNGVGTITGISIVCLSPGAAGNCAPGVISSLLSVPSWVVAAVNTAGITSGQDEQTKEAAQQMASLHFSSLARSQMPALESAAPSFVSVSGSQVKFAKTFVDFENPGFVDLVVDDGSGMVGLTQVGATVTGTVPANGVRFLWHEAPATAPIPTVKVTLAAGGVQFLVEGTDYTSIYERGIIQLNKGVVLQPDDIWEVSGYTIRMGIISELQRHIDGSVSSPHTFPGWVAGGCRCIVQPPTVVPVNFDIHVVPKDGYNAQQAALNAQSAALAFLSSLGPGETMFFGRMIAVLMGSGDLQGVHLYQTGTNTPVGDWYCADKEVLRGTTGTVRVLTSLP